MISGRGQFLGDLYDSGSPVAALRGCAVAFHAVAQNPIVSHSSSVTTSVV
jgi:hypothetical protein